MDRRRELLIRVVLALAALALLVYILVRQQRATQTRWTSFTSGDSRSGARLFRNKGCADCHAVNGAGGGLAPDLGRSRNPPLGLGRLVASMWNHAPRIEQRMRGQGRPVSYPDLTREDCAHLFAYLYAAQLMDPAGDPAEGRRLFASKRCILCHSLGGVGGSVGPNLAKLPQLETPLDWSQAMWNHAPQMEVRALEGELPWPRFENGEMNHLLAFVRQAGGYPRELEPDLLPADPERGWLVLERSGCLGCHAVGGRGGGAGPELGSGRSPALTLMQFAAAMWNHSPEMWAGARARGIPRGAFEGRQVADLFAFLSGLRFTEPAGSPYVGKTVFVERGCAACHGAGGEGGGAAPALRGRPVPLTSLGLAAALWQHGARRHLQAGGLDQPWPVLIAADIGDLLAYLNQTPGQIR